MTQHSMWDIKNVLIKHFFYPRLNVESHLLAVFFCFVVVVVLITGIFVVFAVLCILLDPVNGPRRAGSWNKLSLSVF